MQPAFARWRMLGHVGGGATVFAAQRQALQHAQHDEDDRCGNADTGVGRQQPDAEGGNAHQDDGHEEGVLAPDHIAQAAEHQRTEWPHHKACGEGHQGKDKRRGVVDPGKELFADHRRQGAVEEKVIPLEHRPQGGGEDDLS